MLKNHFLVAFRALRRDRVYALLNGVGLAVALACCLLVGLFVRAERSVDDFHPHADRLRAVWAKMNWSISGDPTLSTPVPRAGSTGSRTASPSGGSRWYWLASWWLLIALVTVGGHALRAANADPVQSLRYE